MTPQQQTTQLRLLTLIRVTQMFMISMPVIVLYWLEHGLMVRDVFVLQSIFAIAVVILEVPSGYLADKFGYRRELIIGTIGGTIGFAIYANAPSYGGFVAAELLLAVGSSFLSGAHEALLYGTLTQSGQASEFAKRQGQQFFYGNFSEATAALLAGAIAYYVGLQAVLHVQWVAFSLSIPCAWFLKEVTVREPGQLQSFHRTLITMVRRQPRLQMLNIFTGVIGASTLLMVWFVQPHWSALGVPVAVFGGLWFTYKCLTGLAAKEAYRLKDHLSPKGILILLALWPVVIYLLLGVVSSIVVILCLMACFWALRGVAKPLLTDMVLAHAQPHEYATTASISQLYTRLIFILYGPFLGGLADTTDFATAYLASGLVVGIGTLGCLAVLLVWPLTARTVAPVHRKQ